MADMTTRSDDLATVLSDLGVEVHKVTGDELNCKCPVHHKVKGRESHRYTFYLNIDTGLWTCFTCGSRGNLSQLVSEMSGDPGVLWNVQSYLITSGLRRLTSEEAVYDDHDQSIDWMSYAQYAPLPKRVLTSRSIDADVASKYGIRWDKELKAVLTPIVSPLGELRGWQQKKTGWVRNYPDGVHKRDTFFGIERAFAPTALLLESPLDVARFHTVYDGMDVSAIASFGANVSNEQIGLIGQRFDGLILALDNDDTGARETRRLAKRLPSLRNGVKYWKYGPNDPKDIGEMTDSQIIKGLGKVSRVL